MEVRATHRYTLLEVATIVVEHLLPQVGIGHSAKKACEAAEQLSETAIRKIVRSYAWHEGNQGRVLIGESILDDEWPPIQELAQTYNERGIR